LLLPPLQAASASATAAITAFPSPGFSKADISIAGRT
jgi:hypothetical protein